MAVNSSRLQITELDFDQIKTNLKTFLRGQSEFTDYDFEGSGMSILVDLLAYNTHYLSMNANMLGNEMFLDSASLRSSVVSLAKTLGYTPRSARSPIAYLDITLNNTTQSSATMNKGTKFTTVVDQTTYTFVTNEDYTVTPVNSILRFSNTPVYEGTLVTTRYTVDTSNVEQQYVLTDNRADTTTLKVSVQESASDSSTTAYTLATDITQLDNESAVFFLQEIDGGRFEVYFGDGVVGKALADGNIVILEYIVTNKEEANGARVFSSVSAIDGVTDLSVFTVSAAGGGAEPETIDQIKFSAPLDYASQGRAVTAEDYKTIIPTLYPNTQALQIWGGEDNDPPIYGKVFISLKPTAGNVLTTLQKSEILRDLQEYNVASITPEIIDPETTFLRLNTTFKFNSRVTTKTASDLETLVTTTLNNYNTSDLEKFDGIFRHSKVTRLIDQTDSSILSNVTTVEMSKLFTPTLNEGKKYTVNFSNRLHNPHPGHNAAFGGITSSTGFKVIGNTNECFIDDDGNGNLRLYYLVGGSVRTYINEELGSIDYVNGTLVIDSLFVSEISNVDGAASTQIRITVRPSSFDIVPVRNQLLEIDFTNSTVTGEVDTIAAGGSSAGTGYTTTASY